MLIGEWAVSPVATESAARWKYFDFFVHTARQYNTSTILWDNGEDFLDRTSDTWRDQTAIDVYMAAKDGIINSLPDSTVDQSATTQLTSAYIFHQYSRNVTDQTLPYLFNGNTLTAITAGNTTLEEGADYTLSNSSITYKASFLSTYVSSTTSPGSVANLTLTFSSGAPLTATIVQWDVPVINQTSSSAAGSNGSDLVIPIQWKGLNKPAAVRALTVNGTILIDDFTEYLGSLQAGRTVSS